MQRPLRIAPSILAADFSRLGEEVKAVEAAGADLIHVDVMDGQFVPNLTVGPNVVKALRKSTTLPLDLHLMIVEPDRFVEPFARAGADIINVHADDLGTLQSGSNRHADRRKQPLVDGPAQQALQEPLAGMADAHRAAQFPQSADRTEQFQVVLGGLSKSDAGIDDYFRGRNPCRHARRDTRRQPIVNIECHVFVRWT